MFIKIKHIFVKFGKFALDFFFNCRLTPGFIKLKISFRPLDSITPNSRREKKMWYRF